jgi:tRNA pseudouridine38-40 synthase
VRYFLDISYKGTDFHGWQRQDNANSVQEEIENALSKLMPEDTAIVGSGRTDTGVHATHQIAHFDAAEIDPDQIQYKLNAMLPDGIAINKCYRVGNDAHARFDADRRTYHYFIHHQKDPFLTRASYYFRPELNLDKIRTAIGILTQWKDFESFSKVHTDVNTFFCDIHEARWEETRNGYQFTISANRFLRGMVRAIVGTLIDVGLRKLSIEEFALLEEQKNRSAAGRSVPPQGLYLVEVHYPPKVYEI